MKLQDIEFEQRILESYSLLEFYKLQVEPRHQSNSNTRESYSLLKSYLLIIYQLEKIILTFIFNSKFEEKQERDFVNLLDIIKNVINDHCFLGDPLLYNKNIPSEQLINAGFYLIGFFQNYSVLMDYQYSKLIFELKKKYLDYIYFRESKHGYECFYDRETREFITSNIDLIKEIEYEIWIERDRRINELKMIFDEVLIKRRSIKALCVNFFNSKNSSEYSNYIIQENLNEFKKKISDNENYLGMFHKLELGLDGKFFYFCVIIFENLKSLPLVAIHKSISDIWKSICSKKNLIKMENYENTVELLNIQFYQNRSLEAGVITKNSESYTKFIRKTLAYIANMQYVARIFRGPYCLIESKPYDLAKKKDISTLHTKIQRKTIKLQHHQNESSFLNAYKLKHVLKPVRKEIQNIELIYTTLSSSMEMNPNQTLGELIHDLIRIEVVVLLATVWKQDSITKIDDNWSENELGYLLRTHTLEESLVDTLSDYISCIGPRVLCFIAAFVKSRETLNFGIVYETNYKNKLQHNIRNFMEMPIKNFLNEIKGLVDDQQLPYEAFTRLNKLLTSQQSSAESLKEWLNIQKRIKKRSFLALQSYVHKMEKLDTSRNVQFTFSFSKEDFSEADRFLRKTIDVFKQMHPELKGYIGWWSISNNNDQLSKFIATMKFYLDPHYIESNGSESWFINLNKIAELQRVKIYGASHEFEIKIEQKYFEDDITQFKKQFGGLALKRAINEHKSNKSSFNHMFTLIHRDLYWMDTSILQKQMLIRGRKNYKKRKIN